jgi:hypothetical protein
MRGNALSPRAEEELLDQALTAVQADNARVANAASTALVKYALQNPRQASALKARLRDLEASKHEEVALRAEKIKNQID